MITTKTSKWYEVKVSFEKMMEDGLTKMVKELYVVDALSFTEAESRITTEMSKVISGEFDVLEEKIAKYKEVIFNEDCNDSRWWKVKIELLSFDEKTEKEKKLPVFYLVEADNNNKAYQTMTSVLDKGMIEYNIVDVVGTRIQEVFVHLSK